MLALYVFSLILGGGFLAASLLGALGGEDLGGDHHEALNGHDVGAEHAAAKIFSLRALIYGLFGFGAAGALLTALDASAPLTLGAAATTGLLSATMVSALFRWVRSEELPEGPGDEAFVGLPGRVTLPIHPDSPGAIAVERGSRSVILRALPAGRGEPLNSQSWKTVVVVDMKDGVARVAPVEDELIAEP